MRFKTRQYCKMLADNNITVIYSGPIWACGIDGIAEMLLRRLEFEDLPQNASQSIFSVFVEQMNNMMMYSAEKEKIPGSDDKGISRGVFILGIDEDDYFIQTGNAVSADNAEILKRRIDYLNTLDKNEKRRFYKQQLKAENDNPESMGAGVGLIEISRRSSSPIQYEMESCDEDDGLQYFSMYIKI